MKKKYIILHHTGGVYNPNTCDLTHYQDLIDGKGSVIKGQEKTSSTGGMNSITHNIACCGRVNDEYPLKKIQIESMCHCAALRCKELGLTPDKCYTHYEIGQMVQSGDIKKLLPYNNLLRQNIGKSDIKVLDFDKSIKDVGAFLRNKILWYYNKTGK